MTRRALALLPLMLLGACVRTPEVPEPATGPRFDPFTFFLGQSEGKAVLHKLFSADVAVRVQSRGHMEGKTLVLDQVIKEGEKRPRRRQWRIRRAGDDNYDGSLTDAVGPIDGAAQGNRLILSFSMKGNLPTTQWLTLAPDGRSAHNILRVRKFGLTIAALEETITRR